MTTWFSRYRLLANPARAVAAGLALCLTAMVLGGCSKEEKSASVHPDGGTYDLWIRNGTVVDGTGADRYQADVLVRGDSIVFVGQLDGAQVQANRTIDASGRIVAPGFIDAHAHGDPVTQSFNNFLAQGYTTVVLGQDGRTAGLEAYGTPDLAHWRAANADQAPQGDPVTLAQWMKLVEEKGSDVNIVSLSGHGTVRLIAGAGSSPEPTAEQMLAMKEILRADMETGAFGMSMGLEYDPGRYTSTAEQKALGDVVGEYDGVVMSHMRSEDFDKISKAIDELLAIDAHVHVAHLKIVAGRSAEEGKAVLEQMASARATGKKVTGDVYPYMASASNLVFLYPDWAKQRDQYEAAVKNRRAELEAHMISRVEERRGPEAILVTKGKYANMRVSEIAKKLNKPYVKVMIDDLGYAGPAQAHFLMAPEVQNEFIRADHVSISTDGAPGINHPRSAGSTVKVLEEHVGEPPKMSLEQAIHKMSQLPATEVLGLEDRGIIAAGAKADLLVLSMDELRNRATWSEAQLPPEGFDAIVVNGAVAMEKNKSSGGRYGTVIRRR